MVLGSCLGPRDPLNELLVTLGLGLLSPVDREDKPPLDDPEVLALPEVVSDNNVEPDLPVVLAENPLVGLEEDAELVVWVPGFPVDKEEVNHAVLKNHELLDPIDPGRLGGSAR